MSNINEDWLLEEFEKRLWDENKFADYQVHGVMAVLLGTMAAYHRAQATKWDGRARFWLMFAIVCGILAAGAALVSLLAG